MTREEMLTYSDTHGNRQALDLLLLTGPDGFDGTIDEYNDLITIFKELEFGFKYIVNKYCGRTYCGNANVNTFDECIAFADDEFCDRAVIKNVETGKKYTINF